MIRSLQGEGVDIDKVMGLDPEEIKRLETENAALKKRESELQRKVNYLLANGAIALALLVGRPYECGISLALLALGLPFYWLFSHREGAPGPTPGGNSSVM